MSVTDIPLPRVYKAAPPPAGRPLLFVWDNAVVVIDDDSVSPDGTGHNYVRRVTADCDCAVTIHRASRRWLPTSYGWTDEVTCDNHSRAAVRAAVWDFLTARLEDERAAFAAFCKS